MIDVFQCTCFRSFAYTVFCGAFHCEILTMLTRNTWTACSNTLLLSASADYYCFKKTLIGSTITNITPSIVSISNDPKRPREAPAAATTPRFPTHEPQSFSSLGFGNEINLQRLFSVKRNAEYLPQHTAALNLQLNRDVPLEHLVPTGYLPGPEWESNPAPVGDDHTFPSQQLSSETLSNGAAVPSHEVYYIRKKELEADNEDAFHVVERGPANVDRKVVKIVHFRKFWLCLLQVAQYWDTSLDPPGSSTSHTIADPNAMDLDTPTTKASNALASQPLELTTCIPAPSQPILPYTGRRTGTGSVMPWRFRVDMINNFLEPIIWAFGCRLEIPQSQPNLQVGNLRVNVDYRGLVYRTPQDRTRNKAGMLEGPLLVIQCRPETKFETEKSRVLDLLQETGAMLLAAQMRAREGTEEKIRNLDKWYVTKRRWGGGSGEACGKALDEETEPEAIDATRPEGSDEPPLKKRGKPESKASRDKKKLARRKWEEVQKSTLPPGPQWDKRVKHIRIGIAKDQVADDVSFPSHCHLDPGTQH